MSGSEGRSDVKHYELTVSLTSFSQSSSWGCSSAQQWQPTRPTTFSRTARSTPLTARILRHRRLPSRVRHISYVGSNDGVTVFVGDKTQVIDLKGQMLLPGFVESHIHPTAALITAGADLQFDSVDQVLASAKKWADSNPHAKVIRGFGWRYMLFPITGPTKADLDKLFPDRPVFLAAIDGHSAWVNSKALEIAGVNAKTPDPVPGFSIYQRDPKTNEPTGWLVEVPAIQAVLKNSIRQPLKQLSRQRKRS